MKSNSWVWFMARLFVGIVFAYSGLTKLLAPIENFRGAIAEYQALPYAVVPFIALVLPWLEFIFGIFMILGYAIPLGAAVLSFLSLAFLLVLGASNVLLYSPWKDCGCFGQTGPIHLKVWQVFLLDLINFSIGLKLFLSKSHPVSLDRLFRKIFG